MKGIILAGGSGTRLFPITHAVSKQLLPVYDKPMIYYPISTLMLAGISEILIITTPHDQEHFRHLLGDGSLWGVRFSYATQEKPEGLAQALIIGEDFLDSQGCILILGDNLFYGPGWRNLLLDARKRASAKGAALFGYEVSYPQDYGVATFDADNKVIDIVEKPENPRSNYAITGLYIYDDTAPLLAKTIRPSARGELEITSLNKLYLEQRTLSLLRLGRGFTWFDTGTHDSLLEASNYVKTLEARQGLRICCPEEIAYNTGLISPDLLKENARRYKNNDYGRYLEQIAQMPPRYP